MARKLSREEANDFLENVLKIHQVQERLQEQRHEFLDDMIRSFHSNISFTSMYIYTDGLMERNFPRPDTIVEQVLTKKSGTCSVLNGFFFQILQHLDYDVFLTNGKVLESPIPNNHVVILIKNLDNEGDLHYVDVGLGLATFKAISLKNLLTSFTFANHTMRIEKRGDIFMRCHYRDPDFFTEGEEWEDFLEFGTTPRDINFFNEAMQSIYFKTAETMLNRMVLALLYPRGKALLLKNMTLKVWNEETKTEEKKVFETIEEAVEEIPKYFPMLEKTLIKNAFLKWKELETTEK